MTQIYFAGQDSFANRGCEALIRSSVKIVREFVPHASFGVPSRDIERDSAQWRSAGLNGVKFIEAEPIPQSIRLWGRMSQIAPVLNARPPAYAITPKTMNALKCCDVVVMTGGDIISLDYGLGSLYYWSRICEVAGKFGKPVVLWAATVGPFTQLPSVEKRMRAFLATLSLITVRDTLSLDYLSSLGIDAHLVADPAFLLDSEQPAIGVLPQFLHSDVPVLGLNVSPLISNFKNGKGSKASVVEEVQAFIYETLQSQNLNVLLVPHVDPWNGSEENSDSAILAHILSGVCAMGISADRIALLPANLNAAEIKAAVGRCTYFMGARTHATIAALSQGIPTTSIAYSMKARGLNVALFGHSNYVLDATDINRSKLTSHFYKLREEESVIKERLNVQLGVLSQKSYLSGKFLKELLTKTE